MNKAEAELNRFLSSFGSFPHTEELARLIRVQEFAKGTVLQKEGEVCLNCYFVLKGCVRQYCILEGEEKTIAFFVEQEAVVDFNSYTSKKPSAYYFSCLEDCILIIGNEEEEKAMYAKFPSLQLLTFEMMSKGFGKSQEAHALFITSSPEERYLNLMKTRPDLMQRAPLHQIASYLGITAESLSRIRKRIQIKE